MLEYRCKKEMLIPRGSNSDRTVTLPAMLHSNSAHTTLNFITRVRAGEVGVAHYPKWRRSLLIHAETRDFHSRRGMGARMIAWGRCTPLTIVDQFCIKISGFTPSFEALGRLLKKKMITKIRKSRMSVKRRRCVWTHRLFLWLEKGP